MRLLRILTLLAGFARAFNPQQPLSFNVHDEPNNGNSTVSTPLFNDIEELARLVDIAYCVGLQGPGIQNPFECPSRCGDFNDFELVTTWNTGLFLSDSCGYIALSHPPNPPRLIIAFRGTYSLTNTLADLATIPQEYAPYPGNDDDDGGHDVPKCENCTVHMGFLQSWRNTREVVLPAIKAAMDIYPSYNLTIVGHSLGGAVAALAGLELLARGYFPVVTTFGEPRLGNQAFATYFDKRFNISRNATQDNPQFRKITHLGDPVPELPLGIWGFRSHSGEIFIAKEEIPPVRNDLRRCSGQKDPQCISGNKADWWKPWGSSTGFGISGLYAHRDYFWRLGLCIPSPGEW